MLIVRAVEDISQYDIRKGDLIRFYIVDAHHHMGKEKTHRNMPSTAYEFYSMLWLELQKMASAMMERDELLFEPVDVAPSEPVGAIFNSRDNWQRNSIGWLVDRTIAFPYTDDYHKTGFPENPSFHISNERIASWSTQAPHSARVIGFARVDPMDEVNGRPGLAVQELRYAIQELGLRGLKLHPLAQLFVDKLDIPPVVKVVETAGELDIPVLFDARNIRTVERIVELTDRIHESGGRPPRVMIGHCGMSPAANKLYDALSNPLVYGETSSLHDRDIPLLLHRGADRIHDPQASWSSKIVFGTDYSFLSVQAAEFILYLLSRDFPGSPADIQRILGGNALSIVHRPYRTSLGRKSSLKSFAAAGEPLQVLKCIIDKVVEKTSSGGWKLASFDPMIPPEATWPRIDPMRTGGNDGVDLYACVFSLQSRDGDQVHVWARPQPGGLYSCAVLAFEDSGGVVSLENDHLGPNMKLIEQINREVKMFGSVRSMCKAISSALS